MKSFMQYAVALAMLFAFAGQSNAGLYKPELKDILLVSVSGYVDLNYDENDYPHDDDDYAYILAKVLVYEMRQATAECQENKKVLFGSGALSPNIKEIYNSFKIKGELDSYRIISAVLNKYARNKGDIYFHEDYRVEHPECLTLWNNTKCEKLKRDYYFDEDTPINSPIVFEVSRDFNGSKYSPTEHYTVKDDFLIRELFPPANMPKTKKLYRSFMDQVTAELIPLKSCLAEVSEIDSTSGAERRKNGSPIAEVNTVFDKFRTQEVINHAEAAKRLQAKRAEEARLGKAKEDRLAREAEQQKKDEVAKRPKVIDTYTDPVSGMEFVYVPGGCFQMGSNNGEENVKPVHDVCLDGFYMGKYEVTNNDYLKVTGDYHRFSGTEDNHPVTSVSWGQAQNFIKELNQKTGKTYRLPTEAEWEYAARSGGKDQKYSGGNDVDAVAWHAYSKGGYEMRPVGQKQPNGLGLYDMSGNAFEWCQDWFGEDYYKHSPRINPKVPSAGTMRVRRGGAFHMPAEDLLTTLRDRDDPEGYEASTSFRVVISDPSR